MKGVKVAEFANATSKRFQSDDIIAGRIHLPDGIEVFNTLKTIAVENQKMMLEIKKLTEENKTMRDNVMTLEKTLKELTEKVDSFETE